MMRVKLTRNWPVWPIRISALSRSLPAALFLTFLRHPLSIVIAGLTHHLKMLDWDFLLRMQHEARVAKLPGKPSCTLIVSPCPKNTNDMRLDKLGFHKTRFLDYNINNKFWLSMIS